MNKTRTVFICPAADRRYCNLIACAQGLDARTDADPDGRTFSIELEPTLGGDVTHYGAHARSAPSFVAAVQAMQGGTLPPIVWEDFDLTESIVLDVLSRMVIDFDEADEYANDIAHFDAIADGLNIVRVITQTEQL